MNFKTKLMKTKVLFLFFFLLVFFTKAQTNQRCDYVIMALEKVELKKSNTVLNGGVGVFDDDGEVKLYDNTIVNSHITAPEINIGDDCHAAQTEFEALNFDVPMFYYNPETNYHSPDITVEEGQEVTLDGSVYGKIEIKQGASVIFTAQKLYLDELKTKEDTNIEFIGCTEIFVNESVDFYKFTTFNSERNNVTVFSDYSVKVDKGSDVTGHFYATKYIDVEGYQDAPTYMRGKFIGKKVKGYKFVTWERDDFCVPCNNGSSGDRSTNVMTTETVVEMTDMSIFDAKAWPNPSKSKFNIQLNTLNNFDDVSIYVYDLNGRLVHKDRMEPNLTYSFGDNLRAGMYLVKLNYGSEYKTMRLIKE